MAKKQAKSFNAELDGLLDGIEIPSDEEVKRETTFKKRSLDPEWRENVTNANRKKHSNPEIAKKIADANRKSAVDPVAYKNRAESNRKKAKDPEWKKALLEGRKKIDQKQIGKKMASDPEWKRKNLEQNRKTAQDPEWRKKMSEINKAKRNSIDYVKKHQDAINKRTQDPEWRQKQAERAIPHYTPYGVFESLKSLCMFLLDNNIFSTSSNTPMVSAGSYVRNKLKKDATNWYRITREEYERLKGNK